jgi:hypothetical protein
VLTDFCFAFFVRNALVFEIHTLWADRVRPATVLLCFEPPLCVGFVAIQTRRLALVERERCRV